MRWVSDEPLFTFEDVKATREFDARRAVAYKTVEIFSGVTGRRLYLVEGDIPSTDLSRITIPFSHEYYYQDLEHELAHILFQSDPTAASLFIEEYVKHAEKQLTAQNVSLDRKKLATSLQIIINATEDHRVNSLWGLLYPGSYKIIKEQDKECLADSLPNAHSGIALYYTCIASGLSPDKGALSAFENACREALAKVEKRGFEATLVVSKWLVAQFLTELIKESSVGDASSKKDRAEALSKLPGRMGDLPTKIQNKLGDVTPPAVPQRGDAKKAVELAAKALRVDVNSPGQVQTVLDSSEKEMDELVASVLSALNPPITSDDWLRKEVGARVVFKDVRRRDITTEAIPLSEEDLATVKRLRAVFHRVMGRRKNVLDDHGHELDVAAYLDGMFSGRHVPCFRQDVTGRGFKALILLDRSGSMAGLASESERACRILLRALKYPFVDLAVWGWNSLDKGQIDISRYDPELETFDSEKSHIAGVTPLHLAVRVGARHVEQGSDAKHLIVTTDGQPVYTRGDGASYMSMQLMAFVREDVQRTRKKGINVTGVIFGGGVENDQMRYMFGESRHWRRMQPDTLGRDLVSLVTTSFLSYLRNG